MRVLKVTALLAFILSLATPATSLPVESTTAPCGGETLGSCVDSTHSCQPVYDEKNYQCGTFNKNRTDSCTAGAYDCNREKNLQCRKSDNEGYQCLCRTDGPSWLWDEKNAKCALPCQGSTDGYCAPDHSCQQSNGEYKCFPKATTQCKLVPPELKVQVCGSFKKSGTVCSIDAVNDCDLGLTCQAGTNGPSTGLQCGAFRATGATCAVNTMNECGSGLSCTSIATDSITGLCCLPGSKIGNGKCIKPCGITFCSSNLQCKTLYGEETPSCGLFNVVEGTGPCTADTDCELGLSCQQSPPNVGTKICGKKLAGESCASNVDCADGLSCTSTVPDSITRLCCPSGNKVENRKCAGPCHGTTFCSNNHQCKTVFREVTPSCGLFNVPEGRGCDSSTDCESGILCKSRFVGFQKTCMRQSRGEPCNKDSDCKPDLKCKTPLGDLTGSKCGSYDNDVGASVTSSTYCKENLYFYKASDKKGTCLNYLSDGEDCTDKVTSMCTGTLKCQEITEGGGKKFVCGTFALKGTSCVVANKRACDSSLECSLRVQILNKDPEYFCCPKDQKYDNGACVPSCGSIVEDKQVSGYCESMGSKCKLIGDTYTCGSFDKEAGSQCTSDNDCNINNGLFCDNKKCKLPTLGQKCYLDSLNTAQDGFACANSVSCRKLTENSVSKIGICCPLADNIKIVKDECLCSETSEHPVENSGIFTCPPKITCSATNPQGTCGGSEVCQRISDKEYGCGIFSKSIAKPCEKLSDCCYGPDCGEIKVSCTMETFAPDKANPETAMGDPLTGKTGGCCPAKNPVFLSSGKCGCAKGLIYDADGDKLCKPQCGGTTNGLCGIYIPTTGKWDKAPGVTCKKIWNGNYECGFHNGAVGYSCTIDHDCQNDRSDLQCRYGNCCQRAQTYTDRPDEDWIWCQPYHECLDANQDTRISNINGRCFRNDDNW